MLRRTFLQQAASVTAASAFQPPPATHPNVIWLLGDQHRAQALSCNGDPNVHTPNLDVMSRMGVNFTGAVSGFPLCCPFRGSMLTGRYPHHCVPGHEYPLPAGQKTLVEPLKAAGYHTAYFGKWHLDGFHERDGRAGLHIVPPSRRANFDTWVGYENNNSQWDCWVHGDAGKDAFQYRLPGYEADALTDIFIKHLQERAKSPQPFFAVLSVQPPHDPYVAPEEYMARFNPAQLQLRPNVPLNAAVQAQARRELAGYYAMIENWDHNIGRIRRVLSDLNLAFNTHIMVFADHGDMHGSHGMYRKMNPFEESIRIPMILSGEIPTYQGRGNGRYPVPFNSVDIAPTTLGLCGLSKPDWMEGTDLSHYRLMNRPKAAEPDSAYLQVVVPTGHPDSTDTPYRGLVTRTGWKYVCFPNRSWVMFDLNEDPFELSNLAQNPKYKSERGKLIERLRQWASDTHDEFAFPAAG